MKWTDTGVCFDKLSFQSQSVLEEFDFYEVRAQQKTHNKQTVTESY